MHLMESRFFSTTTPTTSPEASWNYFEARDKVFCVFKKTNYCFRECTYFPAVKTSLASWCDGTHRIDEKACLMQDNVECVFVPLNFMDFDSDGKCGPTTKSLIAANGTSLQTPIYSNMFSSPPFAIPQALSCQILSAKKSN